ncbi:unnamed protein product [Orchesella dallaii]|uniref:Uncharacterized protein n=1 Tax=Orchesella dallaii TaxID=48710 RepID=A0ABP1PY94_9HEXA
MRTLLKHQCLLLVFSIILATFAFSASAGPAKDKKKLYDKLRNALNQTEPLEEAHNSTVITGAKVENATVTDVASEIKVEENNPEKGDAEESEDAADDEKKEGEEEKPSTEIQKVDGQSSGYLIKLKSVLKRMFDMFGFRQRQKKEGRQNRMLVDDDSYSYNGLEYEYFRDDIRTTVGAVLGEKECIQKIVCGAGSYLRTVNGKNVILTILENVTPTAWMDTMDVLKKSAITDGDCEYKCLEGDEEEHHQ